MIDKKIQQEYCNKCKLNFKDEDKLTYDEAMECSQHYELLLKGMDDVIVTLKYKMG